MARYWMHGSVQPSIFVLNLPIGTKLARNWYPMRGPILASSLGFFLTNMTRTDIIFPSKFKTTVQARIYITHAKLGTV